MGVLVVIDIQVTIHADTLTRIIEFDIVDVFVDVEVSIPVLLRFCEHYCLGSWTVTVIEWFLGGTGVVEGENCGIWCLKGRADEFEDVVHAIAESVLELLDYLLKAVQ